MSFDPAFNFTSIARLRSRAATSLLLISLLLLAACGPTPSDESTAAADSSPAATRHWDESDCGPLPKLIATENGQQLGAKLCDKPASEGQYGETELRFLHRGPQGDVIGSFMIDNTTLEGVTVDDPAVKLWGGHVLTVDLPMERDGLLIAANWTGQGFAITRIDYRTGDEERAAVSFDAQSQRLSVATSMLGTLDYFPDPPDAAEPGLYQQQHLACAIDEAGGIHHALKLYVDRDARVTGMSYASLTPAQDGTQLSCDLDFTPNRFAADVIFEPLDHGGLVIHLDADEPQDDDESSGEGEADAGSGSAPASQQEILIERQGERYRVSLDAELSRYCGQSSVAAQRIELARGMKTCASVESRR